MLVGPPQMRMDPIPWTEHAAVEKPVQPSHPLVLNPKLTDVLRPAQAFKGRQSVLLDMD